MTPQETFLAEAIKHVGSGGRAWVQANTSIGNDKWCAATMCAVGKACGYSGKIMPSSEYVAASFGMQIIEDYGGTYIKGGMYGNFEKPQPGDFLEIQNSDGSGSDGAVGLPQKYQSKHIGVVQYVDGNDVHTIEGNTDGGQYLAKKRNISSIAWYARPDWSKVTGADGGLSPSDGIVSGPLYSSESTRADSTLREVSYFKGSEPSINSTDTKLCVINYTGTLSKLVEAASSYSVSTRSTDDISKMPNIPKLVVSYLVDKLSLNTACAVGIASNIIWNDSYTISIDDSKYVGVFGLPTIRRAVMMSFCGENWKSNLSKQVDYTISELMTSFKDTILSKATDLSNSKESCLSFAETFRSNYRSVYNLSSEVVKTIAEYLWSCVVPVDTEYGSAPSYYSSVDNRRAAKSIVLTSRLILTDKLKVYSGPNNDIYKLWNRANRPDSFGLATLNNYYLITAPKNFGNVGEIIQLKIPNVFINCVIASNSEFSMLTNGVVDRRFPGYNKKVISACNYGKLL